MTGEGKISLIHVAVDLVGGGILKLAVTDGKKRPRSRRRLSYG